MDVSKELHATQTHYFLAAIEESFDFLLVGQDDLRCRVAAFESTRLSNTLSPHSLPQVPPVYNGTRALLKLKRFSGEQPPLSLRHLKCQSHERTFRLRSSGVHQSSSSVTHYTVPGKTSVAFRSSPAANGAPVPATPIRPGDWVLLQRTLRREGRAKKVMFSFQRYM